MKVLIQNSVYFPNVIGGAEISSHLLGQELRRRGIAADAVATTGRVGGGAELTTRPTADGLGTVYEAPAHGVCDLLPPAGAPQPGFARRSLNHLSSVRSARWRRLFDAVLDRVRPDVVHTNTIVGLTPAIWAAAHARGVPVVHTLRDYHLLCPRTTLLRSSQTDCTAPPLPCRVLASLKLRQTHEVQLVTAPSDFVLQKHLAAGGFTGARTAVVPNALEEWPEEVPRRESAGGEVRGLFLGQISRHKGIGLLLEALAGLFADPACSRLRFDLAGRGPLVPEVVAFCAAHPDRAVYHGMVRDEPRRDLLRRASFMVVPSIWAEPFARSIIDGFSWGLPAIGCRQGGIPEVITDGRDGLLVAPTAAGLAAAMAALTTDHARRLRLGEAARSRAADFTLVRQVDRFVELYRDLVADPGPPRRPTAAT
ncbi:MAG: glycosyltransferase [Candidatus Krumholzibacteriia bacterium]